MDCGAERARPRATIASAARIDSMRERLDTLGADLGDAFAQCAADFKSQLATVQAELDQAQALFGDAIARLAGSLTSITAQTSSQQRWR
jgi:hypothetical protein